MRISVARGETVLPSRSKKPALAARRGAASRAAIPAQVLRELHAGRIESRSLVEWLALDLARLAANALPAILGASAAKRVAEAARASVRCRRALRRARARLDGRAARARGRALARESPSAETAYIVRRALRSVRE
jgi:hypothetical protein